MSNTSRLANPQDLVPALKDISKALFTATGTGPLPRTTIGLIQLRAGQIVGNTHLTVLHTTNLRRAGDTEERITGVATWRDAPYYTPAERAALALVEAVLQPSTQGERVPDALYAEVAEHYDDEGIAALAVAKSALTAAATTALAAALLTPPPNPPPHPHPPPHPASSPPDPATRAQHTGFPSPGPRSHPWHCAEDSYFPTGRALSTSSAPTTSPTPRNPATTPSMSAPDRF